MSSGNLAYFVIREIIYAFFKKNQTLDENEIINNVLQELKLNKIIDSLDKTNLDFGVVYCIFDLLTALGFTFLKLDKNQKLYTWKGFSGFYDKNYEFFNKGAPRPVAPEKAPQQNAGASTVGPNTENEPMIPNVYDNFVKAFFERMNSVPNNIVSYIEYHALCVQYLYGGISKFSNL